MIAIGLAATATAAVAWVSTPFIVMNRRGTIVQRQREIMRAEAAHFAAQRRELGLSVGPTIAPVVIPAPRTAAVRDDAVSPTTV